MEKRTKIAEVYGHLHKKILKMSAKESLYLFSNKSMVTLNHTVEHLLTNNGEEDGILYLVYA